MSITYDESQDTLLCIIHRARDLCAMDSTGLSDPFLKINIITAENTLRHTRWQKSRVAHKTINPEFNENFTFLGLSMDEVSNSSLYIVLLDDDKYGNDFLGAAKISLSAVNRRSFLLFILYYLYDYLFSPNQADCQQWNIANDYPIGT